jgi:hypothetical protein
MMAAADETPAKEPRRCGVRSTRGRRHSSAALILTGESAGYSVGWWSDVMPAALALGLVEYVGADPGGTPPPDLTTVPRGDNVDLTFALSFAVDSGDGTFQPVWDTSLTPSLISQVMQTTGASFVASLAGANSPWQDPPDIDGWITNATSSLWNLIGMYQLAGIDVDYEHGVDSTFATAISQVITNLHGMASMRISIAPSRRTWPIYQEVVSSVGPTSLTVNYQAYADGLSDQQSYLALYADLAQFIASVTPPSLTSQGGYYDLALGIDSSTTAPRGLQPPDIYSVLSSLRANGIPSAFVWSVEHSAASGFTIESNIVDILAG